jgi:Holliday junction DNA helicase RuvA
LIGRLHGAVVEEIDATTIVVDVAGVGYEVTVPLGTLGRLGVSGLGGSGLGGSGLGGSGVLSAAGAAPVTLAIHTNVREDALELYGFASSAERAVFRVLLGIPNVGPKLALSVLGSVTIEDLANSVLRGDSAKLTAIPGVGKKTAQRLVLELKDKVDSLRTPGSPLPGAAPAPGPTATRSGGQGELLGSALARMGFRPAEVERAVATLAAQGDLETAPLADLVRQALALLSR